MSYMETYREKHKHPVNKWMHAFGIPMIVISLPIFFVNWVVALVLFVVGWILQFVGHAFEGNMPAFFSNPLYLLIGPFWWVKKIFKSRSASSDTAPSSPDAGKQPSKSVSQP